MATSSSEGEEFKGTTFSAFADDALAFLRDVDQLEPFRALLGVYERGAKAVNSWPKTSILRLGSLRGSTHLPAGWTGGSEISGDYCRARTAPYHVSLYSL